MKRETSFRKYERHLARQHGPAPVQVTKSEADLLDALMRSGMVLKNLIDSRNLLQSYAKPDHWVKPLKESQESIKRAVGGVQLAINEEQERHDEFQSSLQSIRLAKVE